MLLQACPPNVGKITRSLSSAPLRPEARIDPLRSDTNVRFQVSELRALGRLLGVSY